MGWKRKNTGAIVNQQKMHMDIIWFVRNKRLSSAAFLLRLMLTKRNVYLNSPLHSFTVCLKVCVTIISWSIHGQCFSKRQKPVYYTICFLCQLTTRLCVQCPNKTRS